MKTRLTETLIKNTQWKGKEVRLVDASLAGFYVAINKHTKTFKVKADLWVGTPGQKKKIRSVNQTFASVEQISLRDARTQAATYLSQIKAGTDPFKKTETYKYSIKKMVDLFILSRQEKCRRPATYDGYRQISVRYLKSVHNEPAADYELHKAYELHKKLTRDHGAVTADKTLKLLSSSYRYIRPRTPAGTIDHNPFEGFEYNNPKPKNGRTMTLEELPDWHEGLQMIKNPIRRGFHLTMLYSGLRRATASQLEHDWLDEHRSCMNIPGSAMKNGEDLSVPVSDQLIQIFKNASSCSKRMYPRSPWLFPTVGKDGQVTPIVVPREKALDQRTGHTLRRTFRTIAALAGVSDRNGDLLLGHKIAGIRGRYIDEPQLFEQLLHDQKVISHSIDKHMLRG
ncbi:MAG: integrase arm-type DNA-binding domain-containing protein [Tateyamaria sp.]|jgi:integrase|uniref:tyrosine-type recombinase/integrase n=1 Tax=Tateyamaria sp. TaxID=1929288 RepID=UPI0032DE2AE1